jgi:hypothetical protein
LPITFAFGKAVMMMKRREHLTALGLQKSRGGGGKINTFKKKKAGFAEAGGGYY